MNYHQCHIVSPSYKRRRGVLRAEDVGGLCKTLARCWWRRGGGGGEEEEDKELFWLSDCCGGGVGSRPGSGRRHWGHLLIFRLVLLRSLSIHVLHIIKLHWSHLSVSGRSTHIGQMPSSLIPNRILFKLIFLPLTVNFTPFWYIPNAVFKLILLLFK